MKKKIIALLPFAIMPIFIPIYMVLDNLILVEIFGCGCVPSTQANMLNIPFNANDLRMTVFSLLTIVLSIWSIRSVYKELHADRETGCWQQTGAMHPAGSIAPFVVSSPFHGLRVVPCKLT